MQTLLEHSKLMPNTVDSAVIEIFAEENPVLERLPFINIQGSAYTYNREHSLGGIAFRGINESYTESTGVINPETETLTICGGDSDFDVALVAMGNGGPDIRAEYDAMKAKALTLNWLKTFFDGDSSSDPREFDGLNRRLDGTTQELGTSGGAPLSLTAIDELIDAVSGRPDLLLMSKGMRRKVNALMRSADQAIEVVSDAFGRQIPAYASIPIGIVEDDNEGNEILAFDEDDGAGNTDTGSIYAIRFGLDALHGIQTSPLSSRDLGELDTAPKLRRRIEWYSSICIKHPHACARLRYINQ